MATIRPKPDSGKRGIQPATALGRTPSRPTLTTDDLQYLVDIKAHARQLMVDRYCMYCGATLDEYDRRMSDGRCDDCYDAMVHFKTPSMRQRADGTIDDVLDALRPEHV